MVITKKKKMIKINPNPVIEGLPIWNGSLNWKLKPEEISEQTEWDEIENGKHLLVEPSGNTIKNLENLLGYFGSHRIIDNLPIEEIGDYLYDQWATDNIRDPDYLKTILSYHSSIVKHSVGYKKTPYNDNRIIFGKIIVNLNDYLLTPPVLFTSNMDWPVTDVIAEKDWDYLDALLFLNSNDFYYGTQNNTKRDCYFLECDLTLEPLFLVDRDFLI